MIGAKEIASANPYRRGLMVQNTSELPMRLAEDGSPATAETGYLLAPGAGFHVSTNQAVSIYCAEANQSYAAVEV